MGIRDTKYFSWEKLATIPDYSVLGGHVYVDYSSSIYLAYASNSTCSLARSIDGGKNFTTIDQVSDYYDSAIPLFIFRSAINSNYLYYGGYVRNGAGGPGVQTAGWLRKSSDNGTTWITDLFSSGAQTPAPSGFNAMCESPAKRRNCISSRCQLFSWYSSVFLFNCK